jgi:hypothetical protein
LERLHVRLGTDRNAAGILSCTSWANACYAGSSRFNTFSRGSTLRRDTPPLFLRLPYSGEKIPTYLWQSIVAIICCCLPAGVVSLVYAIKVDPAIQAGDISAAKEASKNAKMWFWISFGVGIVVQCVFFGLGVIGTLTE